MDEEVDPGSGAGMTRKEPRWVIPFLRALERTGVARAAALDAGIDYTTAYARRTAHADFADRWATALERHKAAKARAEAEELDAVRAGRWGPSTIASSGNGSPVRPGEDLVVANGQVKRAGNGRWSARKEKIFFDELAATANARRAAGAVGMSKNAVLQRRQRHPAFAAKWDAVVAAAKVNIKLYLIEASNRTFDPDAFETGDVAPKVTIDQAIRIAQLDGGGKNEAGGVEAYDPEEVCARLEKKMDELRRQSLAEGYQLDERHGCLVPPGWVKQAHNQPRGGEGASN